MHVPLDTVLSTRRCLLRARDESDDTLVYSATRDPDFNKALPWDAPKDITELRGKHLKARTAWQSGLAFTFTATTCDIARRIGMISIRRSSPSLTDWSLGYWIHPKYQNRGFATELTRSIVQFGFEVLDAPAITAQCAVCQWHRRWTHPVPWPYGRFQWYNHLEAPGQ